MARLAAMLADARKPMMVLGGPGWSATCAALAAQVAERFGLPVATGFRRQDYIDNDHPNYAGVLGIGPVPDLRRRVAEEVDLLIAVGARFGEMASQGYTLIDIPTPRMRLVQVHPGPEELGRVYAPELALPCGPEPFLRALLALGSGGADRTGWVTANRRSFEAFQEPTEVPGPLNMAHVVAHLRDTMPADTIVTNGAGNYAVWLHRFHRHRRYRSQLAPTSGSMGYGVPAAIAAKLRHPDRPVVAMAGDGCFLMTGQELATARRHGAAVIFLVVNNGMYGTIRMHQERSFPERVIATDLTNPDFVAYAAAFGIPGEAVRKTDAFAGALARARESEAGYLIELVVDPEALTPTQSLSAARAQGRGV